MDPQICFQLLGPFTGRSRPPSSELAPAESREDSSLRSPPQPLFLHHPPREWKTPLWNRQWILPLSSTKSAAAYSFVTDSTITNSCQLLSSSLLLPSFFCPFAIVLPAFAWTMKQLLKLFSYSKTELQKLLYFFFLICIPYSPDTLVREHFWPIWFHAKHCPLHLVPENSTYCTEKYVICNAKQVCDFSHFIFYFYHLASSYFSNHCAFLSLFLLLSVSFLFLSFVGANSFGVCRLLYWLLRDLPNWEVLSIFLSSSCPLSPFCLRMLKKEK